MAHSRKSLLPALSVISAALSLVLAVQVSVQRDSVMPAVEFAFADSALLGQGATRPAVTYAVKDPQEAEVGFRLEVMNRYYFTFCEDNGQSTGRIFDRFNPSTPRAAVFYAGDGKEFFRSVTYNIRDTSVAANRRVIYNPDRIYRYSPTETRELSYQRGTLLYMVITSGNDVWFDCTRGLYEGGRGSITGGSSSSLGPSCNGICDERDRNPVSCIQRSCMTTDPDYEQCKRNADACAAAQRPSCPSDCPAGTNGGTGGAMGGEFRECSNNAPCAAGLTCAPPNSSSCPEYKSPGVPPYRPACCLRTAAPNPGATCGNRICNIFEGETNVICPQDCTGNEGKPCSNGGNAMEECGPGFTCSNIGAAANCPSNAPCATRSACIRVNVPENPSTARCGDGRCEGTETSTNCRSDCR